MSQSVRVSQRQSFSPSSGQVQPNNQDWVCFKCNNLNFSFRKKCNRCKVQSRQDNQRLAYADYYYYNQYYTYHLAQNQRLNNSSTRHAIEHSKHQNHVQVRSQESQNNIDDHLPSVSPLVKKYGGRSQGRGEVIRGLFVWKLFGEQSWDQNQSLLMGGVLKQSQQSLTDDQEPTAQFVRSVQQMII